MTDTPIRNQVSKRDAAEALSDAELDQAVGGTSKSKKGKKKPSSYLQISLTNVHVSS